MPAASHWLKVFGETSVEALTRLHRYEAQIRRAWHSASGELRVRSTLVVSK